MPPSPSILMISYRPANSAPGNSVALDAVRARVAAAAAPGEPILESSGVVRPPLKASDPGNGAATVLSPESIALVKNGLGVAHFPHAAELSGLLVWQTGHSNGI